MSAYFRSSIIVGLIFGLLVSLACPVASTPATAVSLGSLAVQESLQGKRSANFLPITGKLPSSGLGDSSGSSASLNVSSSGSAPLVEGSVLIGPHVILSGTWDPLDIPGFPTIQIKQTCLELSEHLEQEHYGTIMPPVQAGWTPDVNPREAYDFVDLKEGHLVYIEVECGTWSAGEGSPLIHGVNDDLDIFVWPPGVNHTYANSLVGASTCTGCNPDVGTFVAPVTGNYTIGLDYYSGVVPMGWRCYVSAIGFFHGVVMDGRFAEYDTADIGYNDVFDVRLRMITGTSLDDDLSFSTHVIRNVEIINFFPPNVTVLTPGAVPGDEVGGLVIINWTGSDLNTDEVLQYSVEISNDLGKTWKIIAYTTQTSTLWDPQSAFYGLPPTPREADGTRIPNFLVRVNVTDGRFYASDTSDHPWILRNNEGFPIPPLELFIVFLVAMIVILIIVCDVAVFLYRRGGPRKKRVSLPRQSEIIGY